MRSILLNEDMLESRLIEQGLVFRPHDMNSV